MRFLVLLVLAGMTAAAAEEAVVDWQRTYDSGKKDDVADVAVDGWGNIYVAGTTSDDGINSDFLILKYDKYGGLAWDTTYDSGNEDYAYGVATDPEGNVFVSGYSLVDTDQDFRLVKLDSTGRLLWTRNYNLGYDRAAKVAVDGAGAPCIAGYSTVGSDGRFLTVKFTKDGSFLWYKDYGANADDHAMSVCSDGPNNFLVAGYSRKGASTFDMRVIKYDASGNEKLNKTYDMGISEFATGVAADSAGNIYLTGYVPGSDFLTVKLSPVGSESWATVYNPGNEARDIALDRQGNVYVVGEYKSGADYDFTTIKYSNGGIFQWEISAGVYAPRGLSGVALDSDGGVFAAGPSFNGSNVDFTLIKYSQISGVAEPDPSAALPSLVLISTHGSSATLAYTLARDERATLSFYSCAGALVTSPVPLSACQGTYTWDASRLSRGVYFARLDSPQGSRTVKVVILTNS